MTIPVAAFAKRVAAEKPSPVKGAGQLFLRLAPALLALVCLLWSSSARADATLNIANGSIGLRTEGGALQYKQGTGGWTAYTGTLTIEGQKDAQGGIAVSANTVSVTSGAHTVKFNDLAITSGSGAPAGVSSGATLNLILKGTNTLISNVFDFAGLAVPSGATLAISADGNGSLTVNGGGNGAGIGGGWDASGGTVTINGGTLTVNGGDCGAGIGGGGRGSGGAVTINGGTLNVKGGDSGAGIGGGWGGASGGTVTINGGMVTTQGGSGGAGIGGGNGGSSDTVTVSGGTIVATTDEYGAGPYGEDGGAAGIGGGANGAGGTVIVSGGSISATGNVGGAGIGGGDQGVGLSFIVSGGTIVAKGSTSAGVDIGAGHGQTNQGTAVITGGSIHVSNMGPAVTNGSANGNQTVTMKAVNFTSGTAGARVILTSGVPAYYGLNDLFLDENMSVYPWVPGGSAPTGIRAAVRVTFDAQGGGAVAPVTVAAGAALGSAFPADPVLSGYAFGGWFTQANGGGTAFTSATVVTADLTVYAYWKKQEIVFTAQPAAATAVTEGAVSGSLTAAAKITNSSDAPTLSWFACGASGVIPAGAQPLATGGSFDLPTTLTEGTCYYVCQAGFNGLTPVSSSVAAVTVSKLFTVTFDAQGGSAVTAVKTAAGAVLGSAFPADPVLSGSAFGGWFTQANGGGTAFTSATVVTADLTVYARWSHTAILISKQPADQYVTEGQMARFQVNASGEGLSYQWQIDRVAGSSSLNPFVSSARAENWQDLPGAVTDTYVTAQTSLAHNGCLYRCRLSDRYGNVLYSASAELHVTAAAATPQTGDDRQPLLWLLLVVFAGGALVALLKKKRRA